MKKNLFKHLVTGAMVILTLGMTACGAGGAAAIEGPTPEEDIVVKVGNVEIPLTSTWEEFEAIAKKNGWTIDKSLYPVEDWWEISGMDYTNQGNVKTPQGELMVDTMENAENNGAEIESITLSGFYMDSDDASILGVYRTTDPENVKKKFTEWNEDYVNVNYVVDEYVTLKISLDTLDGRHTVTIERTPHNERK